MLAEIEAEHAWQNVIKRILVDAENEVTMTKASLTASRKRVTALGTAIQKLNKKNEEESDD